MAKESTEEFDFEIADQEWQTICPAPSVPKLTEKQGPNLPGAGSRDISWMLPSKPAVPGTARRERSP